MQQTPVINAFFVDRPVGHANNVRVLNAIVEGTPGAPTTLVLSDGVNPAVPFVNPQRIKPSVSGNYTLTASNQYGSVSSGPIAITVN